MKIQVSDSKELKDKEVVVLPVFEDQKTSHSIPAVADFLKDNPKFGKLYEAQLLYAGKQKFLLIGAGKQEKLDFEKVQNIAGCAIKYMLTKAKELTLVWPQEAIDVLSVEKLLEAAVLGVEIATHDPTKDYKSEYEKPTLAGVEVSVPQAPSAAASIIRKAQVIADSVNLVRRLGDMPANEMTPTYFLRYAQKAARENKLKTTVIGEKQAKKLSMGGFVGVAQGSEEPSFMIALEYNGVSHSVPTKVGTSRDKWGLVGKGITFDSGGISIKPAQSMHEMKYDMCGAAAVLGVMQALAKLKVKANVVGVMCVTENLPGGKAQRPGDIVRLYSGKTAEILNTDAEGRMVLVDGLTLAQKKGATKLVDLATLTGACITALGGVCSGALGNNPKFTQDVIVAGSNVGEKIWQLPMYEEYNEMMKSDIADITNIGQGGPMPGAAGAITGAKFLEAVIEKDRPWVHLDIAGTAWDMKAKPYRGIGATGVGVKTLVELISNA